MALPQFKRHPEALVSRNVVASSLDQIPGIIQNFVHNRPLAPISRYFERAMPATATINWATITHMDATTQLSQSGSPTTHSLSEDAAGIRYLLQALCKSIGCFAGLLLLMALVMFLVTYRMTAGKKEARDVKKVYQTESKLKTGRREGHSERHGIMLGLIQDLNINIGAVCHSNEEVIEALAADLKGRMDVENQINKNCVEALTNEIKLAKGGLEARMEKTNADARFTKINLENDKKAAKLQPAYEQRLEAIEYRFQKAVDDQKATQSEPRTAMGQIRALEDNLDDIVRGKTELAAKIEVQETLIEDQRKELYEVKTELGKANEMLKSNQGRWMAVEVGATDAISGLRFTAKALKQDLAEVKSSLANQTREIEIANSSSAEHSKSVKNQVVATLDIAKKKSATLPGTVRLDVRLALEGVQLSIEDLQKENLAREWKIEHFGRSINVLETTVRHIRERLVQAKDALHAETEEVREDLELARWCLRKRIQTTDESLEQFMNRGVELRRDIDDAKHQLGIFRTDIGNLQKKPLPTIEDVDRLPSLVLGQVSRIEGVAELKSEVCRLIESYGRKQARTEKRLQDQGNKIEGHARQLKDIHFILKLLGTSAFVAIPGKTRSARQQKRDAAKKAEMEVADLDDKEKEVSLLPLTELFVRFSGMQDETSRNATMARLPELTISLRLAGVMERCNSRMTPLAITSTLGLPDQFLPLILEPLTYSLQPEQGLTGRLRLLVPGAGGAPRLVESGIKELPTESPKGHVVALSKLDLSSRVCNEREMERVAMAPASFPDFEIPEESCHNSDTKDEAAMGRAATAKDGDEEMQVKRSKAQKRKDRERKRSATEQARVQAIADPSITSESVPSDSILDETAEQAATLGFSSGTRPGSNSQDGFETSVTSSPTSNTPLVRTFGKGLEQSIYATQTSQAGNSSQPKETCRARRLRTYQESLRTGDGHMVANGKWKPNKPNATGGAGRGIGRGGFLGSAFQLKDSLPFQHHNHFPPHRSVHQPPSSPQRPFRQQPFGQQEPFHQQPAFPLQEPFPQPTPDQFDRVWDESLRRWI